MGWGAIAGAAKGVMGKMGGMGGGKGGAGGGATQATFSQPQFGTRESRNSDLAKDLAPQKSKDPFKGE